MTDSTVSILDRKVEYATPWFELVAKRLAGQSAPYYSLRMSDYVTVVALTRNMELLLVRQYRPAVERYTLELPSGHVEKGETPDQAAARELVEECGYEAGKLELLSKLFTDTDRMENQLHCFLAGEATLLPKFTPEPGVERVLLPAARMPELIASGEFGFSMHLAALLLANARSGQTLFTLKS